jgi:hypothetical protein
VAWGGISDREEWGLVVEKHRRRRSRSSGTDRVTVGHHELCGGHGSVSVTELRRTAAKHSHRFARVGPVPSDAQQLQADPAEATGPRAVVLDPPTRGGAERRAIRGHRAWVRLRGGGVAVEAASPCRRTTAFVGRSGEEDDRGGRLRRNVQASPAPHPLQHGHLPTRRRLALALRGGRRINNRDCWSLTTGRGRSAADGD